MIKKSSYLTPNDKIGIWQVNVFHIFGGFKKKTGLIGDFLKISVRLLQKNSIILKKTKFNSIFILSKFISLKNDTSYLKFKTNNCILLKKRLQPVGKEIFGPINIKVKRKKFLYSFSGII